MNFQEAVKEGERIENNVIGGCQKKKSRKIPCSIGLRELLVEVLSPIHPEAGLLIIGSKRSISQERLDDFEDDVFAYRETSSRSRI